MRLTLTVAILLATLTTFARTVSGVIIDEADKEPLAGVFVAIVNGDTIQAHAQTNGNGWFILKDIHQTDITLSLKYTGYESQNISIELSAEDTDMGEIKLTPKVTQLDEITVTGSRVIEKADKYIILPSSTELSRATESLNLLSELKVKMPGLQVNEALKRVTIDGGSPVFQINGKTESFSKIQMLNHNDILRIEYRNTPDIRYAEQNASGIINFVMKPRQEGGTIMTQIDEAVTSLRSNISIAGTYYYKKSEFSLNYSNTWQKSTEQYSLTQEQYIGRDDIITRSQTGKPSNIRDFSNHISLGYTFMYNPTTMFAARLGFATKDINNKNYNTIEETIGTEKSAYDKYNPNKSKSYSPTLDLYFRKNFNEKQTLELNASGTILSGDFSREMHYIYSTASAFDQTNKTNNDSWAAGIEALHSIQIKNATIRYGINYRRNHTENKYAENDAPAQTDKLTRDNLYFYGDIAGSIGKLGYTIGIGGKYFSTNTLSGDEHYTKMKASATLNYRLNKHWSANYLYMYSPGMPPLSAMNDEAHSIDDISLQMGNPYVKPNTYQRNRLYIRYNTGNFYTTVWGSYSRTDNPLNSVWYYDNDPTSAYYQNFITKIENGNYTDNISAQIDISYQNLFDHLTVSATIGWDKYTISEPGEKNTKDKLFTEISANAYFGNWTIFANYAIAPRYSLDGRTFCRDIRFDYFGANYRWKDFSFGAKVINAFTRKGFYQQTETPSKVRPVHNTFYIKDFANMVELSIVYRVNFGKTFNRANRTLQNGGIDTGVDINY